MVMKYRLTKIIIFSAFLLFSLLVASGLRAYFTKETSQEIEGRLEENKKRWIRLLRGMTSEQVKEILGDPNRIVEGPVTTWFYPKGGSVEFVGSKLVKWVKPYSWDY